MKIGIISDTHISKAERDLPQEVYKLFKNTDYIIHAGDISERFVIDKLEKIAPVIAVYGNNDSDELKSFLLQKRIIELGKFKIGILHGDGEKGTTLQRLPIFFMGNQLDCIIFGHSHIPFNKIINNTLYFNPGSPTNKRRQKKFSVGILNLRETIEAEIKFFA